MRARSCLVASATLLAMLAVSSTASAAMTYAPCAPFGFECGQTTVPLDHASLSGGPIVLSAKRKVAPANPTRTAVLALAGGPGQAALPVAETFAALLRPALATRDLLVYDQRGTGTSSRLNCPALDSPEGSILSLVARCAHQIGPARGFFRSADSVDDIEALRAESGYERLVLFAVSYGTKVALDYAARYPARVESLVLDSGVLPEGSDVLNRSTFAAIGPMLAELCSRSACRGVTASARNDLAAVVTKLRREPLRGSINDVRGQRLLLRLTADDLLGILLAGDLNPTLRAELPGSLRSALRGDLEPILRLHARAAGLTGIPSAELRGLHAQGSLDAADSDALFVATRCEESLFPWDRAAGVDQRAEQALAAAQAQARQFRPFGYLVALSSEAIPICLGWPDASPAPTAPGPLPAVPTLIIGGGGDLRTPLADDRAIAARIPGAHVVSVPHTGHSVLTSDVSGCAEAAVAAFFAQQPIATCSAVEQVFTPTPVAPTRFDRLTGRTRALKAIVALRATITDIRRQFIGDAIAVGRGDVPTGARAAGLRSGTALWTRAGIRFRRVEYVPGVVVSGVRPHAASSRATYRLSGLSDIRGTVTLYADGRVAGTLDGRAIAASVARSARAQANPALPERLPRYARLGR